MLSGCETEEDEQKGRIFWKGILETKISNGEEQKQAHPVYCFQYRALGEKGQAIQLQNQNSNCRVTSDARQRGSASTLHGRKPGLASSDELLKIQPLLNTANSLLAVCHT